MIASVAADCLADVQAWAGLPATTFSSGDHPFNPRAEPTLYDYLIVGLGGFLGACARYALGVWAAQRWGPGFPYGTLIINVSGSLALGFLLAATAARFDVDPRWRLLVGVGFLGAYTTFSTFTYESVQLLLAGQLWPGLANLLGSNLLGLAAAVLGIALGRRVV